nr:hypothetical protein CFP56_65218 [Quercus suber]
MDPCNIDLLIDHPFDVIDQHKVEYILVICPQRRGFRPQGHLFRNSKLPTHVDCTCMMDLKSRVARSYGPRPPVLPARTLSIMQDSIRTRATSRMRKCARGVFYRACRARTGTAIGNRADQVYGSATNDSQSSLLAA